MRPRILIAEDEQNLAAGMAFNFDKRGYDVEVVSRGDKALETATRDAFDLIILDVMMPGMDGFRVCEELRRRKVRTPILILTARHETEHRVHGLRMGADDYVGKPFDLEELLLRTEALLRRRGWNDDLKTEERFRIGPVEFDANLLLLRDTRSPDRTESLTAIESRLLQLLLNERGKTIPRPQILKKVWGLREETQTRTLDTFIMRLRQHLERVGGSPEWIESVRGVGYRFTSNIEPA